MTDRVTNDSSHIAVLDGWRAVSITLVLLAHWFPTPRVLHLNAMAGAAGMALFFTLSGFLITRMLWDDQRIVPFLTRRLFRILPLAWAAVTILVLVNVPPANVVLANYLFYSNLPPAKLMVGGNHLWSLCVEIQFYGAVAALVAIGGRKALYALPLFAIAITVARIIAAQPISIVTWHRVDEILAGAIVALIYTKRSFWPLQHALPAWLLYTTFVALLICSHEYGGSLQYLRPYLAGSVILVSLVSTPNILLRLLQTRTARYIARISYALYVIHGLLTATWLGGGSSSKPVQYLLRIPLAFLTFLIAHLSTFYYERIWMIWGKRLSQRST